jgi:uncharacterized protein (TIGR04141 family)
MPKVPALTKRTSVSLLVNGVSFDQAVPGTRHASELKIASLRARLISDTSIGVASWISDVALLTGETISAPSHFSGAVLLLEEPGGRVWAITWGGGHTYLDAETIDYAFPRAVIARSALPGEVKSVTKKLLDARARVDRATQPAGATMRDLGVDGNGEAVAQLDAKVSISGLTVGSGPIALRAGAALNLPLAKDSAKLVSDLAVLLDLLQLPVVPGMEAVEQLVAIRPKEPLVKTLELELETALLAPNDGRLGVSWPEERLALRGISETLKVVGVGDNRPRYFEGTVEASDVRSLFAKVPKPVVASRLKAISISAHSDNPPTAGGLVSGSVPLRRWLSFEVKQGTQRYCLFDGEWYRMDDRYLGHIDARVGEILAETASVSLPVWPTSEVEGDYNLRAAASLGGICLDRKLITTPLHSRGGIEPCDIYVPDGILVHVKRGTSSSSLSHLFAQAFVSSDALARDEYARLAWEKRLETLAGSPVLNSSPREVVLAIGRKSEVTVDSLFTFTKVNLVRQYDQLRAARVDVRVAWIPE